MKSPRFARRESELRPIIEIGQLKRAWKDKVRSTLRAQDILDPIEHLDFHVELDRECKNIRDTICAGEYTPSPSKRILVEKAKGLCRQLVLPSVQDAVVLQCLSDALYADIKGKAPTKKSFFEPSDHSFSKSHEGLFGEPQYGTFKAWLNFQKEIFKFSKARKYVVVTDVANYYDSISYYQLRNIIAGLIDVRESVLDMLIFVLSGLLWQPDYMPRMEIGLPQMDVDAPRILAHSFLYELDDYLESQFGGDYVRFMDDIDIGVDSIAQAKSILRDIDLVLQTRQVRLNSGKTLILSSDEAIGHFRIRENLFLDRLVRHIDYRLAAKKNIEREKLLVRNYLSRLYPKRMGAGNGEKILRRLLSIATKIDANIDAKTILHILRLRPGSRSNAFRAFAKIKMTPARASIFPSLLSSGYVVDEATYTALANALVESCASSKSPIEAIVSKVMTLLDPKNFFQLYSAIWIMSKYATADDLYLFVRDNIPYWRSDSVLGRLIGGLMPIFIGTTRQDEFTQILRQSGNIGAKQVYNFHSRLSSSLKAYKAIAGIISAPNSSKALGTTHAKFLLVLSALANKQIPSSAKQKLITAHSAAWRDPFYRAKARSVVFPNSLASSIK